MEPILPPSVRLSRRPVVFIPRMKSMHVHRHRRRQVVIAITILVMGFAFGLLLARVFLNDTTVSSANTSFASHAKK
jgi:hypothetical protein